MWVSSLLIFHGSYMNFDSVACVSNGILLFIYLHEVYYVYHLKHCFFTLTGNGNPFYNHSQLLLFINCNHQPLFDLFPPLLLCSQDGNHWGREVSSIPLSTFFPFWEAENQSGLRFLYCQCERTYAVKTVSASTEVWDLRHSLSSTTHISLETYETM